MRIAFCGQREMPHVLIAVPSLFQAPQHQITEDALLWLALDLRDQLLIISRRQVRVIQRHNLAAAPEVASQTAHFS